MERWRDARGQATSEYVALVALVAVALGLAAGITAGGVGGQLLAGLQRGICRVADVACTRLSPPEADLPPCPLERTTSAESLDGAFELLRLGRSGTLTAVRGSDGRVTVTLADGATAGGGVGLGFSIGLGGHEREGATAEVEASVSSGRSWTLPDAAAVRAFVARYGSKATIGGKAVDLVRSGCSILCDAIGWRPHAELPPPDEVYTANGGEGGLHAALGGAELEASGGVLLGTSSRRDGSRTRYLQLDAATGAALVAGPLALGARAELETVLAYTRDAQRRPLQLVVHVAARAGGDVTVDGTRGSGAATAGFGGARAVELDATLDLRDARNRRAVDALVAALGDPLAPAALGRSALALRERIERAAVLDRRTYAVSSSAFELGAEGALGGRLGGSFARTREAARLLSAETRLPGLPFLPRDDCRAA